MKQPIAVLITDTHLHKDNIEETIQSFEQAIELCKELKVQVILHLGDWFNNRIGQPLSVLNATCKKIKKLLQKEGIVLIAIPGNHDKTDLNSSESYLDVFHEFPSFIVVDEGRDITDYITEFNRTPRFSPKVAVTMLPYFKEDGQYVPKLQELKSKLDFKQKTILLTHIATTSVKNNDGSIVNNDITQDIFKEFHKVLIGHYHNRQQITKNIHYIGSDRPQNYGEDSDKGFTILYDDGSIKYYRPQFKEYTKFKVKLEELTPEFIKGLKGYHVKVVIQGPEAKVKTFDRKILTDLGVEVECEIEEIVNSMNMVVSEEVKLHTKSSIIQEFDNFCELYEIPKDSKLVGQTYLSVL